MKDKLTEVERLKSSEVEKLKSQSLSTGKTEPFNSSTFQPFNSSTLQPFNRSEEVYRRCLKQERDRERCGRGTLQGAFEASFVHIDYGSENSREDSPSWLSDNGRGEEAIVAACDGETPETRYQHVLRNARRRLKRAKPHLVEVFDLVMENGANRKESICRLMNRA